ncbi:hypothetical protein TIFTF001_000840 [Ficus carica]|uniref:AAA+ ATPase domain-containing protein n=1 Tax=Ficus carica TaxID=3494 RepID=A0AA88CKT1_FICCA|nr:hypothetical protein TIFTF001_000840 [Ficus carica]
MDCAVNVGAAILGKIGEYTVAPVGRHLSYLVYYNRNVTNLETQIRQLRNAKDRLHHAVDEATRNAEGIEADVEEWLSKVNETINAADGSIQQCQAGASNFGHCNIVSRYQLSRKAANMAREIHEMKEDQVTKCNRISYRLTLQCAFKNKLYQEFQSRKETFNDVVAALRDPKFSMVALYGTGGVGKTMLAEEIARWTLEHNLFSTAIMVSISHSVDVERVQREIAERLGLTLTERALRTRAERIQRRLEQEKEILLILDDIWVKFALADVGISFGDDQRGCKILVTSRFQHLLFDDHIDATINFQVGLLSDAEAENLFNKIVGNSVDHFEFKVLAPKIIKECACLRITITMVARALRNKNLTMWNDALRQLRSSIITGIQGMEESVYKNIRLSYDHLKSEEELLLLFCSLREEDAWSSFPMLFKYATGWSLFQDVYKLEETRDRLYALLNELQARSLLKEIQDADCVKVHHIVRHVALSIASKEMKMHHVKNAGELKRLSRINKLKDSVVIFICNDHDHERLPERLECPNLKFLFISRASFPDQFFEETKMLRALDMTCAGFERLPSSICALQNLRML